MTTLWRLYAQLHSRASTSPQARAVMPCTQVVEPATYKRSPVFRSDKRIC